MKLTLLILLFILAVGCEPWIMLKPISTSIDNEFIIKEDGYYIIEDDTIGINCVAYFPNETDSSSSFVVVDIWTTYEDLKWENMSSYLLVDRFNQSVGTERIDKIPVDFSEKWGYQYEIIFESNEGLKFPLKFQLITLNKKEYFISFGWEIWAGS